MTPFINICFLVRSSAVIPELLKDVLAIMTAHAMVHRQPDVDSFLKDIKSLDHNASSTAWDRYDIIHTQYFNDWWKVNLAGCRVSDLLPKSSLQDVMELVEDFFSELVSDLKSRHLPDLNGIPNRMTT
jgi:hypothetical protein